MTTLDLRLQRFLYSMTHDESTLSSSSPSTNWFANEGGIHSTSTSSSNINPTTCTPMMHDIPQKNDNAKDNTKDKDDNNNKNKKESNDNLIITRKKRCPLHKLIRQQNWLIVKQEMQRDPISILQMNGVGWSSLILAVYHGAPIEILSEMLHLTKCLPPPLSSSSSSSSSSQEEQPAVSSSSSQQQQQQVLLLSTPIPNGNRLCLHFAARYCTTLEAIQLLTEPYPRALLMKSMDGIRPLDRAIYYRKSPDIVSWMETMTQQEEQRLALDEYNRKLHTTLWNCCELRHQGHVGHDGQQYHLHNNNDSFSTSSEQHCGINNTTNNNHCHSRHEINNEDTDRIRGDFIVQIYSYTKEREMISLFQDIVSYVGVHQLPSSQQQQQQPQQ